MADDDDEVGGYEEKIKFVSQIAQPLVSTSNSRGNKLLDVECLVLHLLCIVLLSGTQYDPQSY